MNGEGLTTLRIDAETMFRDYAAGRLDRTDLCAWIVSLSDHDCPLRHRLMIAEAKLWFALDTSRRSREEMVIHDLGWLLKLTGEDDDS